MNLGVIGVGGLGHLQLGVYDDMEEVEIVAAADVSAAARDVFEAEFHAPAYDNYRMLLHEHADALDAVTIVTPHTLHYEQAKACLERDLHVLVEKPMVTDVADAIDLVDSARARDLVLQVGYQRHFHPAFQELRRILQGRRIGDLHMVNCYLGQDWIDVHRGTWRADPSLSGGGQLYDSGSHLFDALLWTTGASPATVTAQVEYEDPEVDVNSSVSVRLDRDGDSALASVALTGNGVEIDPSEGYFYWGTEGRASYFDDQIAVAEKGAMTYSTEITAETDFRTLNRKKLENFIASIEGTATPAVPGEYGLQVTALTEAIYRAAETGGVVSVPTLIEDARERLAH